MGRVQVAGTQINTRLAPPCLQPTQPPRDPLQAPAAASLFISLVQGLNVRCPKPITRIPDPGLPPRILQELEGPTELRGCLAERPPPLHPPSRPEAATVLDPKQGPVQTCSEPLWAVATASCPACEHLLQVKAGVAGTISHHRG